MKKSCRIFIHCLDLAVLKNPTEKEHGLSKSEGSGLMMYLSDSWTDSVDKLGGKAIGLNKLLAIANDTFQVPPFTVLTAESFLLHISGRGLQFNHTHDFSNEQIGQILDHILYGDIPADIVSEVEQWFEKAKKPLCVRSSCVSED